MKYTTLVEIHKKLGATFAEKHSGWHLPTQYTDPITEHHAVRSNVGITDISYQGTLKLTGEDRAQFLHRLISNDVEGLSVGEGNYATLLTNRGKMIADLRVYILENEISISTAPETIDAVFAELDKYIIADDVELTNESDEIGTLGIYGPNSSELLQEVLDFSELNKLQEYHSKAVEHENQRILCVKTKIVGNCGYHLYISNNAMEWLWNALLDAKQSAIPIGWEALESLRIETGTPRYGTELTDSVIPLEAELEHAIDFEKGCYIGQEIVARMKYRGHPNRLLRGIVIETENPVQQDARIFNGDKEVGWITSSCYSPTLEKPIALGYVRMVVTDEGSQVQVNTSDGLVKGTVKTLPFVDTSS